MVVVVSVGKLLAVYGEVVDSRAGQGRKGKEQGRGGRRAGSAPVVGG